VVKLGIVELGAVELGAVELGALELGAVELGAAGELGAVELGRDSEPNTIYIHVRRVQSAKTQSPLKIGAPGSSCVPPPSRSPSSL
jgi:hypothetical protein